MHAMPSLKACKMQGNIKNSGNLKLCSYLEPFWTIKKPIYIIKADVCLFVCGHSNVQMLTSPPILKLWNTQGYLWLPYDQTEIMKLIGERFEPIFFSKTQFHQSQMQNLRIVLTNIIMVSFSTAQTEINSWEKFVKQIGVTNW